MPEPRVTIHTCNSSASPRIGLGLFGFGASPNQSPSFLQPPYTLLYPSLFFLSTRAIQHILSARFLLLLVYKWLKPLTPRMHPFLLRPSLCTFIIFNCYCCCCCLSVGRSIMWNEGKLHLCKPSCIVFLITCCGPC